MENQPHVVQQSMVKVCLDLLQDDDIDSALDIFLTLHISEAISILENISVSTRLALIKKLDQSFFKKYVSWLPDYMMQDVIDAKGTDFITLLIKEIKNEDISYQIVKDLDDEEKNQILHALSQHNRISIEKKLSYPKDSAGRLMQSHFPRALKEWSVTQCVHYLKEVDKNKGDDDYLIDDTFIVDNKGFAMGAFPTYKLLTAPSHEIIKNLQDNNYKTVHVNTDQEEVALLFKNRGLSTIGVVDDNNILLGVISIDDIIDVIYKENEEDFLLVSGAENQSSGKYRKIFFSSQARLRWLSFNIISAVSIPFVVTNFEDVLAKHVIIAALIQFVVALGGNAGMQSLGVTIRGLALKTITSANMMGQISKELLIALINGLLLGCIGLVWGVVWGGGNYLYSLVAFLAVWVNVMLGVTFGTLFPILLNRLRIDPAIASSICVTTATDVVGFFAVLAIASAVL